MTQHFRDEGFARHRAESGAPVSAEPERQALHAMLMEAPAAIATYRGAELVIELINPLARQILGDRPVVGRPLLQCAPELAGTELHRLFVEVQATGKAVSASEVRILLDRRGDGALEEGYFNLAVQPLRARDGGVDGVMAFAVEVTDQVLARRKIERLAAQLKGMAEASLAVNGAQSVDEVLRELTERARSLIGAHQSVISMTADQNWAQAINAVSLSDKYAAWRSYEARPDGSGIYALVCQLNRPFRMTQAELEAHPAFRRFGSHADRHPPMRGWLAVPLVGRDGESLGLMQLSDKVEGDFTEDDEAILVQLAHLASVAVENARLREQALAGERRFRSMVEATAVVVWTTSPAGLVTEDSPSWRGFTGQSYEEWAGYGWLDAVHPEDRARADAAWRRALETRSRYEVEYRLRRSDGSWADTIARGVPILDRGGAVLEWVGCNVDISEIRRAEEALRAEIAAQKRAEAERERLIAALERSNAELDQFAYVTSHDLKAPLRGISSLSQWIEEDMGPLLTGESREQMRLLRGRVKRMEALIDGILDYSRAGRARHRPAPVDVGRLLAEVIELLAPGPGARVEVEPGMPTLFTERVPLQQVFMNLVGNALKHGEREREGAAVRVSAREAGAQVEFSVSDSGPGIAPEYHERIWVLFQKLEARDRVEGAGIGLSVVKKIVESRGGRVSVESAEGRGATFRFTWPSREPGAGDHE